ncbi:MAG TPA: HIT family protein [Acidimicrobiaceae bacterium]|nr:HIT family protein [Acidimicrobiaceae bacterium]
MPPDPAPAGAASGCAFCAIVAGDVPSLRVYEDDHAVAFMDRLPMTPGHCLVVPRRHVVDIWDLTDDDAARVLRACRRMAHLLRDRLGARGVNLVNNNGAAADQTQFHYHVHVIPRYGGDRLLHAWERSPAPPGEIAAAHALLTGGGGPAVD